MVLSTLIKFKHTLFQTLLHSRALSHTRTLVHITSAYTPVRDLSMPQAEIEGEIARSQGTWKTASTTASSSLRGMEHDLVLKVQGDGVPYKRRPKCAGATRPRVGLTSLD